MKSETLTARQVEILRLLRDKRGGSDRGLFDAALSGTLPRESIQRICEMINDEYLLEGVGKNYVPNSYGIELEELLDVINRPRISHLTK
jgi:hypothetical protein